MVPRLDADALVDALALQLPAGRVPLRASWSTRTARRGRDEPEFELRRHRRLRRRPLLGDHGRLREGRARRHAASASRSRNAGPDDGDAPRPADALVPQHVVVGRRRRRSRRSRLERRRARRRAPRARRARTSSASGDARAAVLRERDERRAAVRGRRARRRTRRTASTTTSSTAPTTVNPDADGHEGGALRTGSTVRGRRDRGASALRLGRARPTSAPTSTDDDGRARGARPTSSTPSSRPPARPPTRRWCCARRFAGMLWQAVLPLRRRALARRRPGRARRRPRAPARPQRASGAPQQRTTSSRCPTRGSTRGTPRGTSPSTASRSPTSTPSFAKEQLLLLLPRVVHAPERPAARRTSGRSATSTRRCTPGPRCGCSRSTAARDYEFLERDLPQAAPQLHLVGEPQGRRGQQRVRGRLPRPRQHRPVRPLGAAARRRPCSSSPTARRGWRCTASNLLEMALLLAEHDPTLRGPGHEVLRALRATSPTAMNEPGPVGRGGRLLLRRAAHAGRRARCRCGSARWSACSRSCAVDDARPRRRSTQLPDFAARIAWFSSNQPRVRRRGRPAHARSGGTRAAAAVDRRTRAAAPHARARCSTRTSSCRRTACARSRSVHRDHPFTLELGGVTCTRRLRAGRVDDRPVRRQLELARARSGSRSTTCSIEALRALPPLLRRRLHGRVPDRLGPRADARARSPTSSARGSIAPVPRRRRRPAAGVRRATSCFQTDPAWHDLLPFHEYFHGDTGAGLGASHQTGWTGLVADLIIRRTRSA